MTDYQSAVQELKTDGEEIDELIYHSEGTDFKALAYHYGDDSKSFALYDDDENLVSSFQIDGGSIEAFAEFLRIKL